MHDTLKKPREILMVSYGVRFPELAAKSKSVAGEVDMDPAVSTIRCSHGHTDPHIPLDCGTRPPTAIVSGAIDSGDYLLQFYIQDAFPIRYQSRANVRWYVRVIPTEFKLIRGFSHEKVDQARVATSD